jgi:hypothetical protein
MDGRKRNKGTKGNKGGRPPKAEEQELVEKLSPLDDKAFKALDKGLQEGKNWAVKLYFEYRYGKPKETVTTTHNINDFNLKDLISFD